MAIYKPTDCNPFNGTFDTSADLPIIFECKVDTSNTVVTGYSIEIYDSNNNLIFPTGEKGPIESNVTYLSDLRTYFNKNFSYYVTKSRNVNSGLNGTYLEIPFYVKEKDKADNSSTVSRNQMSENSTPKLVEGQTYTWKITLYQEVENGTQKTFPPAEEKFYDMTVANGTVIGSNEKRIQTALIDSDDKVIDNLVLIDKFVQPILIKDLKKSTDPDVSYDPATPKDWVGSIPTTFSTIRSLITGYDSSYGYIYPSTAADNAFAEGQIVPENVNGFQIFKNGNDPANLGATDMVSFIYDEDHFKGTKTWKTTPAKPELSYWEQVYVTDGNPNGVYYPFEGETYGKYPFSGEERIIFNKIQSSKVVLDGNYYGSPYNGIFRPQFSSKEAVVLPPGEYTFKENLSLKNIGDQSLDFIVLLTDQGGPTGVGMKVTDSQLFYNIKDGDSIKTQEVYSEKKWIGPYDNKTIRIDRAQTVTKDFFDWFANNVTTQIEESSSYGVIVTVIWNRTTDASNWGTLSNKIIYNQQDGKNYEINTATQIGEINKTPFKFVEEKPVKIFNTAKLQPGEIPKPEKVVRMDSNSCSFSVDFAISSLSSVTLNDVDVTKNCIFEIGQKNIIYTSSSVLPDTLDFKVTYVPYVDQDYAGTIFYNKMPTANGDTGYLYIRPTININKNMIFKELTTTSGSTWFNIDEFNKDYNFITYKYKAGMNFIPKIDKTRYQIKSFYKDSDYNPFSIYKNPEIASYLIINGEQQEEALKINGETNYVGARNFSVTAEYIQNSYISWKNYQWILYDAKKRTILEKTDEKYNGEITGMFYGLEQDTFYILSLALQTNTGKIIEIDYVLQTNFEESGAKPDIVAADFDCDTLAMKATVNLENTIIAPEANQYLRSGADIPSSETAYYYNGANDIYTKNGSAIASVESGILTITGNNSLDFQRSFAGYEISDNTQSADIQINSDQIVVEGSFSFSQDYQGDIFSLTNDDSGASVRINVPVALENIGGDGLVKLSDDIDKIGANGSYLKIYREGSESSFEWQNASDFHNTSIWKEDNKDWSFGNRINVANFKYAEIRIGDKNSAPYPYEKGKEVVAEDGARIFWNQIRADNSIMGSGTTTAKYATIGNVETSIEYGHKYYVSLYAKYGDGNTNTGEVFFKLGNMEDSQFVLGLSNLKENEFSLYEKIGVLTLNKDEKQGNSSAFQKYSDSTQTLSLEWKNLQIFDLTLMFGSGNEPNNVDEFWNYFGNRFYDKNTYLNINAPYNSYDSAKPLKNPMDPKEQPVDFYDKASDGPSTCTDGTFQINEPDRLIWLDYTPVASQMAVVVNANSVNGVTTVTTQPMTVMKDEPLKWNDNSVWKDGIYVESGFPKTLIGQISINGTVVQTDCLDATTPITYSNSGLTKQKQVDEQISERNSISTYNFAFRIFINTNTFSVDTSNSYCYVTKKPQEGRMKH